MRIPIPSIVIIIVIIIFLEKIVRNKSVLTGHADFQLLVLKVPVLPAMFRHDAGNTAQNMKCYRNITKLFQSAYACHVGARLKFVSFLGTTPVFRYRSSRCYTIVCVHGIRCLNHVFRLCWLVSAQVLMVLGTKILGFIRCVTSAFN